jgi:hypothetical protein
MELLDVLLKYWPLLAGLLALVVWLVRLEGKHSHNHDMIVACQADLKSLTIKHESLDSKVVEQLAQVRESLARIEGALGVKERS